MPFRKYVFLLSNFKLTVPHNYNSPDSHSLQFINQLYHSGAYEIKGVTPSTL